MLRTIWFGWGRSVSIESWCDSRKNGFYNKKTKIIFVKILQFVVEEDLLIEGRFFEKDQSILILADSPVNNFVARALIKDLGKFPK